MRDDPYGSIPEAIKQQIRDLDYSEKGRKENRSVAIGFTHHGPINITPEKAAFLNRLSLVKDMSMLSQLDMDADEFAPGVFPQGTPKIIQRSKMNQLLWGLYDRWPDGFVIKKRVFIITVKIDREDWGRICNAIVGPKLITGPQN